MTEDQFVADIRERYALQSLINLVQNGAIVSDAQAEQLVANSGDTRYPFGNIQSRSALFLE